MSAFRLLAIALGAALALGAGSAAARQDDPRLDALFAALKDQHAGPAAADAERKIWEIWIEHRDPVVAHAMAEGAVAFGAGRTVEALDAFTEASGRDAGFAEAWNKRATVEFTIGDYTASVADIERTLTLEPRHFGALSGLGQIYLKLGKKPAALKAFAAALAIDPHLPGVQATVEALRKELAGDPI
jgi:tetratricopeptide (TPR) repeat protein